MRVQLIEWTKPAPDKMETWVCTGEFHLDEVAERLGEPMMSVAWDRDLPGLSPQPEIDAEGTKMYGPVGEHPIRIFGLRGDSDEGYRMDVALMFVDGEWAWRGNGWDRSTGRVLDDGRFNQKVSIVGNSVVSLRLVTHPPVRYKRP